MSLSIKDPLVKIALTGAEMAVNHVLDLILQKHPNDHKTADAVNAARAAIDAALETLENL